jgi:hypothetical protein
MVLRFHLVESPKLESNAANRLVTLQASSHIRVNLALEVKTQLVVNLAIDGRAFEQRALPEHPVSDHGLSC